MNLKHLTNNTLLTETKRLAQIERTMITKILHHLKEIEKRKLFSELGYPNMLEYAVKELGYSEPSAARRINAARMLREMPEIESKIHDGTLNLTTLNQAAGFFRKEDIKEPIKKKVILKKLENKSKRQTEKTLFELSPHPLPLEGVRIVSKDHHQIKVNVTDETLKLLEDAKSLLGQHIMDEPFFKKLTEHALQNIRFKKYKTRATIQDPKSRYLTNQTKREVYEKSQGVCELCGSLFMLQYDHIKAFSLGGESTPSNLRLLCFHCNQRARICNLNQP